jgi:hypothetical protein
MASKFTELAIDCADPNALARFWCSVLDCEVHEEGDDGVVTIGSSMVPEGEHRHGRKPPPLTFTLMPAATAQSMLRSVPARLEGGANQEPAVDLRAELASVVFVPGLEADRLVVDEVLDGPFGVLDHEATVQTRNSPAIAVDDRSREFS